MEEVLTAPEVEEQECMAEGLPLDILELACEYADRVEGTPRMMGIDEARQRIYSRMGWS